MVSSSPLTAFLKQSVLAVPVGGTLCALAYAWLATQSTGYGAATLSDLLYTSGFCGAVTGMLWLGHHRGLVLLQPAVVLAFALLFRIIGLSAYPVLEDDFFRYLWDGAMTVAQGTPYDVPPAAYFDRPLPAFADESLLSRINYPEVATVYGPVAQWGFALSHWLAPGSITALQTMAAVADMATLAVLMRLAPAGGAFLYAFSPLLIKEFAMSAHVDALGIVFLTLALLAFAKRYWVGLGVLLALAAGVKIFALVATPFLLGRAIRGWLAFALTAVLIALPFGLQSAWLPQGLGIMAGQWQFNAPVALALEALDWPRPLPLIAFAAVWLFAYWRWLRAWNSTIALQDCALGRLPLHWLFGLFLLALPVLNPWYLAWWLPFAALRPSITPWTATIAVLLSYASGINLGASAGVALQLYQIPGWIQILEWALISVALGTDLCLAPRRPKNPAA